MLFGCLVIWWVGCLVGCTILWLRTVIRANKTTKQQNNKTTTKITNCNHFVIFTIILFVCFKYLLYFCNIKSNKNIILLPLTPFSTTKCHDI